MDKNQKIALGVIGVGVGIGAIGLGTRKAGASGGGGNGKVTQIKGWITGELTTPIPSAAVSIAGYQAVTDATGYYSIAVDLAPQDTTVASVGP